MAKISREEVLKMAAISKMALQEEEVAPLTKQLEDVLSYAERVAELAATVDGVIHKNVNVVREDVVEGTSVEPILSQAPEREGDYFVVPKIIENN